MLQLLRKLLLRSVGFIVLASTVLEGKLLSRLLLVLLDEDHGFQVVDVVDLVGVRMLPEETVLTQLRSVSPEFLQERVQRKLPSQRSVIQPVDGFQAKQTAIVR